VARVEAVVAGFVEAFVMVSRQSIVTDCLTEKEKGAAQRRRRTAIAGRSWIVAESHSRVSEATIDC